VYRQGFKLLLGEHEVGYFQCSGIDAMIMMHVLQLLISRKPTVFEFAVPEVQYQELREWINKS